MNTTMNNNRPEFMECDASYETPEFTIDDLEEAFRAVLGNDAVDRANNPVGMALEDAYHREQEYKTPFDKWNQPQRPWVPENVTNPEDPEQQDLLRDRRQNNEECEMCPSTDFAPDSTLCRDCQQGIEKQEAERCECGREVHWGYGDCRFCMKEQLSKDLDQNDEVEWSFHQIQLMFRTFEQLNEFIGEHTYRIEGDRIRFGQGCNECLQLRANGGTTGIKRTRDRGCVACHHEESSIDPDFGAMACGGGCIGCGEPGQDNDQCSRLCKHDY